jgi:prepilin-type N-terminal cleavage/methylation domain-containing protein/prepilin-type processing-associated H-X9-DG protein
MTRRAFTLLEVIVVAAITAVLIGLTLPAIWHARARADEVRCQNNLRQQGVAVLGYESTHTVLPPRAAAGPCPALGLPDGVGHGLYAYLLPYLDEGGRASRYRWDLSAADPGNADAVAGTIGVLRCPLADDADPDAAGGGGANYGPIAVNETLIDLGLTPAGTSPQGALLANERARMADISDGASTTLLLTESGVNSPWATTATTVPARMVVLGFPGPHGSGVNVCLADGSVRRLKVGPNAAIYGGLATRNGGEPAANDD